MRELNWKVCRLKVHAKLWAEIKIQLVEIVGNSKNFLLIFSSSYTGITVHKIENLCVSIFFRSGIKGNYSFTKWLSLFEPIKAWKKSNITYDFREPKPFKKIMLKGSPLDRGGVSAELLELINWASQSSSSRIQLVPRMACRRVFACANTVKRGRVMLAMKWREINRRLKGRAYERRQLIVRK